MLDFEKVWTRFDYVLQEMREGMCLFEGYIPSVEKDALEPALLKITTGALRHRFEPLILSDTLLSKELRQDYDINETIASFEASDRSSLHCDYEVRSGNTDLSQKLIFEKLDDLISVEIICYRDPILAAPSPKLAVADAIAEFRRLKTLLCGNALFIGPDNLDFPTSTIDYPQHWLKIE